MKVLLTTTGNDRGSQIDPRFGRAEKFAIVDTETGDFYVIGNDDAREASQGAGIKAAELAANLSVRTIITGNCGPKAYAALQAAGIEVISGVSGSVDEAIESFKAGRLQPAAAPNVKGHWA